MIKNIFIICIICTLLQSCLSMNASHETVDNENAIHIGNARLEVSLIIVDVASDSLFEINNFMNGIEIYCNTRSIFDPSRDGTLIPLSKSVGKSIVFQNEIPLECKEEVVGLKLMKNSEFGGGTECIISQDSINRITLIINPSGRFMNCLYPTGTSGDWMSIAAIGYFSEMADPSLFVPHDKSLYDKSWKEVTKNMVDSIWPEFYRQSMRDFELPIFAEKWVENTLKKRFASACILPYVRNADMLLGKSVAHPPMKAYYFLDDINYSPNVFLMNDMNFPQAWFLENILKHPDGGFESIGETPVATWQKYADKKLSPAMKKRPKLLLDLLSGMSYVNQIDEGNPLSDIQINNIKEGYSDDIGKIILNRNEKLLSSMRESI